MGLSYDWATEVTTCLPEYYRWNQWFFLQDVRAGLAYRKKSKVNWCPECQTVLANEQVVDGNCWRHDDTLVEQRDLTQWFLRITKYADELLDGLDRLDGWPEKVRTMQRNWIGRSEGALVDFAVERVSGQKQSSVFTTRIDTIFGATSVQLAPEHAVAKSFAAGNPGLAGADRRDARRSRRPRARRATSARSKSTASTPANSPSIPSTANLCRSGLQIIFWPTTAPAPS